MKKAEKISLLYAAKSNKIECVIKFVAECQDAYCFPIEFSDRLLLFAEEIDFSVDGYMVYRLADIHDIDIPNDIYSFILQEEKIVDQVVKPDVDITDWCSLFLSLQRLDKFVIVNMRYGLAEPAFGKVVSCNKDLVGIKCFDRTTAEWYDTVLAYSDIRSVSFGNHYLEVWEKYVK